MWSCRRGRQAPETGAGDVAASPADRASSSRNSQFPSESPIMPNSSTPPTPPSRPENVSAYGYTETLERGTGKFASFAVAFAFVSIATGIFTTYGSVLNSSGPMGIWTWPIVIVGQVAVALLLGSLAARIPRDRLRVPVGVAAGQPHPRLDHRVDLVHVPGDRRRRGGLHRGGHRGARIVRLHRNPVDVIRDHRRGAAAAGHLGRTARPNGPSGSTTSPSPRS